MTDLPELRVTNSTAPNLWQSAPNNALQLISAANDGNFGQVSENTTGDYDQGWVLANMPDFFANMETLAIQLRYFWGAAPELSAWPLLAARVMNGGTVLAAANAGGNFQTVASNITTTTPTNSGVISFSFVNTTANEATWNGAVVEIRIGRERNKGGSTSPQRISACSVTGTYTPAANPAVVPTLLTPADEAVVADPTFTWEFNTDNDDVGAEQGAVAFKKAIGNIDWSITSGPSTLNSQGNDVAFSPDGTLIAVALQSTPYLAVINTSNWTIVGGTPTLTGSGQSVAFSPNGAFLAVGHHGDRLRVLNTSNWSTVNTPTIPWTGNGVAFSPDGAFLAVGHDISPFLTIIQTSNWTIVGGTPTLTGQGMDVAFSPNGAFLAVAHQVSPRLTIVNTSGWTVVSGTPTLNGNGRSVAFSLDSDTLAVGLDASPNLNIINVFDWSVISGTPTLPNSVHGVTFSPDGFYILAAYLEVGGEHLSVINTSDWSVVDGTPALPGWGRGVAFISSGEYFVASHAESPFVTVVDAPQDVEWWTGTEWSIAETWITSGVESLSIPVGSFGVYNTPVLWTVATRETVTLLESFYPAARQVEVFIPTPVLLTPVDQGEISPFQDNDFTWDAQQDQEGFAFEVYDDEGNKAYWDDSSNDFTPWKTVNPSVLEALTIPAGKLLDPFDDRVYGEVMFSVMHEVGGSVRSVHTFDRSFNETTGIPVPGAHESHISPDGAWLAICSPSMLVVVDLSTGRFVDFIYTPVGSFINTPSFSPDSTKLAFIDFGISNEERLIRILNINTMSLLSVPQEGHQNGTFSLQDLAWSPDSRYLAMSSWGSLQSVRVLDTQLMTYSALFNSWLSNAGATVHIGTNIDWDPQGEFLVGGWKHSDVGGTFDSNNTIARNLNRLWNTSGGAQSWPQFSVHGALNGGSISKWTWDGAYVMQRFWTRGAAMDNRNSRVVNRAGSIQVHEFINFDSNVLEPHPDGMYIWTSGGNIRLINDESPWNQISVNNVGLSGPTQMPARPRHFSVNPTLSTL